MTSKERAALRAQANTIDTTLMVGKGGVSETLVAEAQKLLDIHELVKGRVPVSYTHRDVYKRQDDTQFGCPVVRYPSVDLTKLVGYHAGLPFSSQTLEKLVEQRFDLIHCHCPVTSAMLARALRDRIHVPLVFTYHTKFDIDIANAIKGKLLQEEAKKVLVDNITCLLYTSRCV